MEKDRSSCEQSSPPPFEQLQKGKWYQVLTDNPLLDREANRLENNSNGAVIARILLSKEKMIDVVDFGAPNQPTPVVWHPDYGEIPALGTIRERFGVRAVNFGPDDGRLFGFSPFIPGETILGRNTGAASYGLGIGGDDEYNRTHNMTISRDHCRIFVPDDQGSIFIIDKSTHGTELLGQAKIYEE